MDKRAFTRPTHVKVKLDVLGFDPAMWGDLEHFKGLMVDRYYQEVIRASMFSVQFGRSVGIREVKVCDITSDDAQPTEGGAHRCLNFEAASSEPAPTTTIVSSVGPSDIPHISAQCLHPLHPVALLLSDTNLDGEWATEYRDYCEGATIGVLLCLCCLTCLLGSVAMEVAVHGTFRILLLLDLQMLTHANVRRALTPSSRLGCLCNTEANKT
jgi:hypothetical protein